MEKLKITKVKIIVILLVLTIVLALVGATRAYFVDHSEKNNAFTVGNVDIKLTEERYNEKENIEKRKRVAPNQFIVKDPKVTNVGSSDCYVFIEFTIPKTFNFPYTEEGMIDPYSFVEIVEPGIYRACDAFSFAADKNWTLVKTEEVPADFPDTVLGRELPQTYETKYIYAYGIGDANTGKMTPLKKGETTTSVFKDEVIQYNDIFNMMPFWDNMGENVGGGEEVVAFLKELSKVFRENLEIPIKAYAVQSMEDDGITKTDPLSVYNTLIQQAKATGGK